MGVRGLTSFIARNADQYLKPFELHDCNLVIDGDNLACNLYKQATGNCSAFGGDYDDFYRIVVEFFHVLTECNIQSYVLMDGGYERKKLRTVAQRLRGKIAVIKRINPIGSAPVFPLMMREVFVDALHDCGVPVMRCIFEADDELAALSQKLNCPILSYDSDFYIHNVKYIPLVTLTVKAHTKRIKDKGIDRKLRKCEAIQMEKRTKANHIVSEIHVDAIEKKTKSHYKVYKYLDCCMYKLSNLIAKKSLSKEKMPLFAALLGNDYISRGCFRSFFSQMKKARPSRKLKQQQRRITAILQWLKHETVESASEKILSRLRVDQRAALVEQIQIATQGYRTRKCQSYTFFNAYYQQKIKDCSDESSSENDEETDFGTDEGNGQIENDMNEDEQDVGSATESVTTSDAENDLEEVDSSFHSGENSKDNEDESAQLNFPNWFLEKLYPAQLPRFFVDLMHLQMYINNPQIEHFPFSECNGLALRILKYIFTLLQYAVDDENRLQLTESETPTIFRYLTRETRITKVHYEHIPVGPPPAVPFNVQSPDPILFKIIFSDTAENLNIDDLFLKLDALPADIRLYFLSIVYWLHNSKHCDILHMHSLLICLVVLRTIDANIDPIRDLKEFQKRFGKVVKKERAVRDCKIAAGKDSKEIRADLKVLSPPDRMKFIDKSDCILVQDNLLKYFHIPETFKKKYDTFSTCILHGFAEFQSVVFNLLSLNALLGSQFVQPRMGQSYSGVFLYNIYELLRSRIDLRHYIQNFVFRDSLLMFELYDFLADWCSQFFPASKRVLDTPQVVSKKVLQRRKAALRKKTPDGNIQHLDPYNDMIDKCSNKEENDNDDDFSDINNKFCTLLKLR